MTTWHADAAMLRGYQDGALGAAHTASVEAHLSACAACRTALATIADRPRLDRSWAAITDRLDERSVSSVERVLTRIGVRDHRARLVVMTPALRGASLASLAIVLALASMATVADGGERDNVFYAFLVLAPLLPLAGVAAAFGSIGDPGRELTASTPTPAFELLLVRSLAIVTVTTVVSAAAALPFPAGWDAAAWLLPALGLTAATLALSTWMAAHRAAVGLGMAWLGAAAVSWRANRVDPDVLERFVALRPAGQALFAVAAVAGAITFLLRRDVLDLRRFA